MQAAIASFLNANAGSMGRIAGSALSQMGVANVSSILTQDNINYARLAMPYAQAAVGTGIDKIKNHVDRFRNRKSGDRLTPEPPVADQTTSTVEPDEEPEAASQLRSERRQDQQDVDQTATTNESSSFQDENTSQPVIAGGKVDEDREQDTRRQLDKERRSPQSADNKERDAGPDKSIGGQLRSARQALKEMPRIGFGKKTPKKDKSVVDKNVEKIAKVALRKSWQKLQSIVDGLVFSIWYLAFIVGPFSIILIMARLSLRFVSVSYRGADIPLGPSYGVKDIPYIIKTLAAIGLMAAEWLLIAIIVSIIQSYADSLPG